MYRVFKHNLSNFKPTFFWTKLHSKQKPFIFGILSRGDLCIDNQFLGCLPCAASTASYLKDTTFLMILCRKACVMFQAKMTSVQLEWPIPFHSIAIVKNTLILEIWPPRPFWGHLRPHFKMFSNDSDSIFIQSYCQNDQEIASMSSVQAWPQRLIWRPLRLGLVNDWISRLMHKFHH